MHNSDYHNGLNWLGSKFSILPWLLPKLKRNTSWVDVCGGSGCVTINKKPDPIETYNDINGDVCNFFRVFRDNPEELIDKLYLTPHSRWEYENSWYNAGDSDIERARKFFVRTRQSFLATGSQQKLKGWISATKQTRCRISEATSKYLGGIDGLQDIIERWRRIQIENRSWEWILEAYDSPNTTMYFDPPYDMAKRSGNKDYAFDFTEDDHIKMANRLHSVDVKSAIAVSGYNTDFMKDLYRDFYYVEGPSRKNNMSSKKDVRECLWTNYDPFNCNNQNSLFNHG